MQSELPKKLRTLLQPDISPPGRHICCPGVNVSGIAPQAMIDEDRSAAFIERAAEIEPKVSPGFTTYLGHIASCLGQIIEVSLYYVVIPRVRFFNRMYKTNLCLTRKRL